MIAYHEFARLFPPRRAGAQRRVRVRCPARRGVEVGSRDDADRGTDRDRHVDHAAGRPPNLWVLRAVYLLLVVPLGTFREEHGWAADKSKGQLFGGRRRLGFVHEQCQRGSKAVQIVFFTHRADFAVAEKARQSQRPEAALDDFDVAVGPAK